MTTELNDNGGAVQTYGSPFVRFLRALSRVLGAFEKQVAALSMIVIMVAIAATIVVRLFNLPLPSLGEIVVVAMSPLTFIGGALCSHLHQHITIDVVELMPNNLLKTLLRGLSALSMAVFGAYLLGWHGICSAMPSLLANGSSTWEHQSGYQLDVWSSGPHLSAFIQSSTFC